MIAISHSSSLALLRAQFLELLPGVENHAQRYFRDIRCPARKADLIAETVALVWKWFRRVAEKGQNAVRHIVSIARYAARAVKCGRRLVRQEPAKDVLSPIARLRHGFKVESLPVSTRRRQEDIYGLVHGQQELDAYEERLRDNGVTPPPDAAAFRIDFPRFLGALSERDRAIAMFLSLGYGAKAAAARFGLTPGRVTQIRQRLCRDWHAMHGESVSA